MPASRWKPLAVPTRRRAAGSTLQSASADYPVGANSLWAWPAVRLAPVSCTLLLAVMANGCANQSSTVARSPSTSVELPGAQAEHRVSSRADRLRDLSGHGAPPAQRLERTPTADTSTRAFGPASMQQSVQPPESTDEPDPGAVIDWLLKQTR